MRRDILEKKGLIEKWIEEEIPKFEICRRLCCKHTTLNSYLKKWGLNIVGIKVGEVMSM